ELLTLVAVVTAGSAAGLPPAAVAVALAVAVGLWAPARGVDDFVTGLDAAFAAAARVREVTDAPPLVRDPKRPRPIPAAIPSTSAATPTSGVLDAGVPDSAGGRPTPSSGVLDAGVPDSAGGRPTPPGTPPAAEPAAVEFDQVTFSYPGASVPALTEVSAAFPSGSHACVVGVSGSGKSTLAGLLLRGWDAQTGSVRVHGVDVREAALDELRGRVALVPQRPTLLSGTIADNLRLAAPTAGDDELRRAATVAGFDVDALPDGLATVIAERGLNLSGGQLQRLAIARALVAAPDILVLDEALSQLDAGTAHLVRDRLAHHRVGLTTIEITHRADLIPDQTPTVVLDAGRVVEQGTAGDLRAADGAFRRLEAR
ncbi:MAG: ABC transporter ATP-binding protein, partial [Propionicimonas sp.]|nr:ABC transporter ATP-binding protein [Propionicimonas sp.]